MSLKNIRNDIDKIDASILRSLKKRFALVQKAMAFKKQHNLPIEDKARESQILMKSKTFALNNNVDPEYTTRVMKNIITTGKKPYLSEEKVSSETKKPEAKK